MIGKIVGNYKIIQALGEGGVGMVYKGVDTMLDREVAIKVLRPELASQTSVVERFRSEAVTLAKLSHPNIATLYSLFRQGDDLFMVLEFIKGQTLDQILYQRGRIPTDEAIPIFCQSLEGINYAHERGIVHRDIKPGNMMLNEKGILKVLDFGIARLLGTNRMTRVGNVIGTLEYMSPEQVKGLDTDARSDVYGLGIMLYEILTGRLPFESENDFELMKMQTEMMPVSPCSLNPDIPFEVEAAILKSVAKDPNARFQSAGDFLNTFLEMGFALPNTTFGFGTIYGKKNSRPSNPGMPQGEIRQSSLEGNAPILNSQIPTEPIVTFPKSEIPVTLEVGEQLRKEGMGETRVAKIENKSAQQSEIKGTRLAAPTAPNSGELKATRLGVADSNEIFTSNINQKSNSIFGQLNWIYYTVAGAVVLFFFSLVAVAGVLQFIGGGEPKKEEPKTLGQKTTEPKNTTATPEPTSQPIVKDEPKSEPIKDNGSSLPVNSPIVTNPTPEMTPIPNTTTQTQSQPKQRETVKNNPPRQQQQQQKQTSPPPAPRQQPEPEPRRNKDDARKHMTGN